MYPGYLRVVVDALIIVLTIEFVYAKVGFYNFNLSVTILVRALLSMTTQASAFKMSLLSASKQLYG
jgi:hypothetical protein